MILYHGSYMEISHPDIYHSRKSVDFGQGFYTTPIRKIELYFDGLIDKYEAIVRLRYEKPNLQYCFRTQSSIDKFLRFKGSEIL